MHVSRPALTVPSLLLLAAMAPIACTSDEEPVAVTVFPATASLATGASAQFTARVTGLANPAVDWSIQETSGGSIDTSGLYVAPDFLGTFHVVATSVTDRTRSGSASVTVMPAMPTANCATEPLRATGAIYYYCDCGTGAATGCIPGNDTNTGTNASAPRRTLANARTRFNGMNAGDTVALCRGGAWDEGGGQISNTRCSATDTCDFREYVPPWGNSSTPRPRLNVGTSSAFAMTARGHDEGYRFWNLDIRHSGSGYTFQTYDDVWHVDICNVRGEGGGIGFYDANGGPREAPVYHVRHSQFHGYRNDAILAGTINIESNLFENNGLGGTIYDHTIYLCSAVGTPSVGARVRNNVIVTDTRCNGVQLVLHCEHDNMLVENNRVVNTGGTANCYGIQIAHSGQIARYRNAILRRNRVRHTGGGGTPTQIEVQSCIDCVISDNVVEFEGGTAINGAASAPVGNATVTSGTIIQNNTVIGSGGGTGFAVPNYTGNGGNFVVENNVAFLASTGTCFNVTVPTVRNGNNFCRSAAVSSEITLSDVFVDAPAGDFRPATAGPLIGTGNATYYSPTAIGTVQWTATDAGAPRSPPIDLGAFKAP